MKRAVLFLFFYLIQTFSFCQDVFNELERGNKGIRIGFYNVENLFDIKNDPLKRDDEFTKNGEKHWTLNKYKKKLNQISKVVTAVGGWEPIELMTFCELENKSVLYDLITQTPLKESGYKIIHYDSPDRRGIDVGFIYRPDKIDVIYSEAIPIIFPWDSAYKTRDILYAKLVILKKDTLDIYINHWPSRWGGQLETDESRQHVAKTLITHITKQNKTTSRKWIALGDFNDSPFDNSIKKVVKARLDTSKESSVYNMMYPYINKTGTNKYHGNWEIIDQILVSNTLFKSKEKAYIKNQRAWIYSPSFLLEIDEKFGGKQLKRTYLGMRYKGGYSDHLPIYIDLGF